MPSHVSPWVFPRLLRRSGAIALGVVLGSSGLGAQPPPSSVSVSSAVDTSLRDVRDIVRLVRAYFAQPDASAAGRGLWSATDSLDRRLGDLARFFAYYGNPATVASVMSTGPGDTVYVVKVFHAAFDSVGRALEPWALQRMHAIRDPGAPYGWQLSAPLIRVTRDWPTKTVGRITFHYDPGQHADSVRATQAATFVDSVAALFAVRAPQHLDYFVTASPDEYLRAVGLDFLMIPSGSWGYGGGTGGNAVPEVGLVLAGDPSQRETYLHELAHAILGRGFGGAFLAEGIATWLGGSRGRTVTETFRRLGVYQVAHPRVTLEQLVRGDAGWGVPENEARYATGALFVAAVFRRGGVDALRALASTPGEPAAVLAAMRERLGLSTTDAMALDRWWRAATRDAAQVP